MSHYREIADARFDAEQSARMAQNFERMNADHLSPSSAFDDMARGLGYAVIFAAVFVGVGVTAAIVFN
jgi:hypothetical protein